MQVAATCVGLLVASALYCIILVVFRLYFHPLSKFPGPKLAAATSWYEAYFDLAVRPGGQFFLHLKKLHQKYGPIIRINPHEIHIEDSTWINNLYCNPANGLRNKHTPAAHMIGTPDGTFGTVHYDIHRKRRAAVSPLFSKGACAASESYIYKNVDLFLDGIDHQVRTTGFAELRRNFLALTTDVLCDHCFGRSTGMLADPQAAEEWQSTIKTTAALTPLVKQVPWIMPLSFKFPLWILQVVAPDMARIIKKRRDIDQQAKEAIAAKEEVGDGLIKTRYKQSNDSRLDIFETILSSPSLPPAEKEFARVGQEGFVVLAAGGETTARALTAATYHILANRDAVLPRLMEELYQVMPEETTQASLKELESLAWLGAIVKETLRILALITSRLPVTSPNQELVYKEWAIPAGTPIGLSIRDLLLDPDVFEEPTRFKPERWLTSGPELQRMMHNYVPFSRGSRMCLGMNLSIAELHIVLASLFRRREMTLHDTIWERDMKHVRDCFVGEPSLQSQGMRIKYTKV